MDVGNLAAARDFVDVRDAVQGYVMLIENDQSDVTYNLASGKATTIRQLLATLIEIGGIAITIRTSEALLQENEVSIQVGSYRRLAEATGWFPHIPLESSLRDLLDSIRA